MERSFKGITCWICFFLKTSIGVTSKDAVDQNNVCFLVEDDKICILDPAMDYYTSSGFPFYDLSSDDIREETKHWINTYDLGRVKWIFSATLWKEFSTTEEFIIWMYTKY